MTDIKVLLCDDDPDLLSLISRRLEKMGLEHDMAGDGRLAISLVEKNTYDVIVTDIYMPEATGLEVLQLAKQRDPDIQVVIITSSATLDNAIDSLNHGAFGYLTKPFDHLIVFDNMVSRAAEYRQLLIANKHRAEAQRRRGDMLEDEVAERVQQIQKKQKGLLDLLGSLPDGILVVEEGGKVVLSSPVGERWLARDGKSENQPIHTFISQVNAPTAERTAKVRVEEHDLQLIAVDFPADGEMRRKAVIIREVESDGIGAGSLVTETVLGIKKGLATLYQQGVGTEAVLNLASQFAVLEQLAGWSPGPPERPTSADPIKNEVSPLPTPVEESEGPELNTAELAEALRAAAQVGSEPIQQAVPAVQVESAPEPLPELLTEPVPEAPSPAASKPVEPAPLAPRLEAEASSEPTTVAEPTFPKAEPRELDPVARPVDTAMFRPRIIPEAMSTKLGEPPPIQPANGKRRMIRIGSSAADTQIFRRVLEKMSGETVIGVGEPEPEFATATDKPRSEARDVSPAPAAELEPSPDPVSALRQLAIAAEPDLVAEEMPEPVVLPKRKSKPKESEPRPAPTQRAAASWPPKLPSKDPDWDDSLEATE